MTIETLDAERLLSDGVYKQLTVGDAELLNSALKELKSKSMKKEVTLKTHSWGDKEVSRVSVSPLNEDTFAVTLKSEREELSMVFTTDLITTESNTTTKLKSLAALDINADGIMDSASYVELNSSDSFLVELGVQTEVTFSENQGDGPTEMMVKDYDISDWPFFDMRITPQSVEVYEDTIGTGEFNSITRIDTEGRKSVSTFVDPVPNTLQSIRTVVKDTEVNEDIEDILPDELIERFISNGGPVQWMQEIQKRTEAE